LTIIDFSQERARRLGVFYFDPSPFAGSAADEVRLPEEVGRMRRLYPELWHWPDLALENALARYLGMTFGYGWPDETKERYEEFLAFVYLVLVGAEFPPSGAAAALRQVAALRPWIRAP